MTCSANATARMLVAAAIALGALSARAAAPKVVKTTPEANDTAVDPALRELRVVFDQPMDRGGGWSVVGGGEKFPKFLGKGRWIDDRTFAWTMQLQPDHEYWLSINNQNFQNFRSKTGQSAEPYPISFKTKAGPAASAKLTPEMNRQAIADLRRAIDEDYSYRDLRKLDWDKLFKDYQPKLEGATSAKQFAQEAGRMLAATSDIHIWLEVDGQIIPAFRRDVRPNMSIVTLPQFVPNWKQRSNSVWTGRFDDGIGYILIANWDVGKSKELDAAFAALKEMENLKGMIIDVRPNSGGSELIARNFAGCFLNEPKIYAKDLIRSGGRFSDPQLRIVEPSPSGIKFRGKVAVLTGPHIMSSCESFLMMMKQVPGCRLVGQKSYGASGNPHPLTLSNTVTVYLPSWQDQFPDGTPLEMQGVSPDIQVATEPKDFLNDDPVLKAALQALRK